MKSIRLSIAVVATALSLTRAPAVQMGGSVIADLSANFDSLNSSSVLANQYTEGGITFSSPNNISVVTDYFSSVIFADGSLLTRNPGILFNNTSYATISAASGMQMVGVEFSMGYDWDFFSRALGLMDVYFGWQAYIGSTLVGAGTSGPMNHPGGISITDAFGFDRLLVTSTAVAYQSIYSGTGTVFLRGDVIGWGNANHIALDDVHVQLGGFPDGTLHVGDQDGGVFTIFLLVCLSLTVTRIFPAKTT